MVPEGVSALLCVCSWLAEGVRPGRLEDFGQLPGRRQSMQLLCCAGACLKFSGSATSQVFPGEAGVCASAQKLEISTKAWDLIIVTSTHPAIGLFLAWCT